jgi:hypothetical protein
MTDLDSVDEPGDEGVGYAAGESDELARSWTEIPDHGLATYHGLAFSHERINTFRQV